MPAGYARSIDATKVYYGAHSSDYGMYPDCRPDFVKEIEQLNSISLGDNNIRIIAPLIHMNKVDVISHAHKLEVPLSKTWSCYNGGEMHCGKCSSCIERKESFIEARVVDLTAYWHESMS